MKFIYIFYFLIITIVSTKKFSFANIDNHNLFSNKSFGDNVNASLNRYEREKSYAKNLADTLDRLIALPRQNINDSVVRSDILIIFQYIYNGFELIDSVADKNDFNFTDSTILNKMEDRNSFKNMIEITEKIQAIYNYRFRDYLKSFDSHNNVTIVFFFQNPIFKNNFTNNLKMLQLHTMPKPDDFAKRIGVSKNIFQAYYDRYKNVEQLTECGMIPVSDQLFYLYKKILSAVMKGYTSMIVGYDFMHLRNRVYNINKASQLFYQRTYSSIINNIQIGYEKIVSWLETVHRTHKNCDPEWVEGKNYIRVKNYVSITTNIKSVQNIKVIKNADNEFECNSYKVNTYSTSTTIITRRCPGIFERSINDICRGSKANDININSYNISSSIYCAHGGVNQVTLNNLCYCDQSSDTKLNIRTVSLMEHLTNSLDNRVVTGLRFAVKNKIITIEIQEGQLVNGIVDPTSVKWKTDLGYLPENGPDSVRLNYHFKSFNLDDIELPYGQFVTGVKFILMGNNHLSLKVRGTQMYNHLSNYPSVDHDWHYPHFKYDEERILINIKDFANSAEVLNQTTELSRSGRDYINLSVGLYSNEFHNLAVIPFLDSQNVVTEPPAPLGGLGLYYKSQLGYGGFLSFKLIKVKNNFY